MPPTDWIWYSDTLIHTTLLLKSRINVTPVLICIGRIPKFITVQTKSSNKEIRMKICPIPYPIKIGAKRLKISTRVVERITSDNKSVLIILFLLVMLDKDILVMLSTFMDKLFVCCEYSMEDSS